MKDSQTTCLCVLIFLIGIAIGYGLKKGMINEPYLDEDDQKRRREARKRLQNA